VLFRHAGEKRRTGEGAFIPPESAFHPSTRPPSVGVFASEPHSGRRSVSGRQAVVPRPRPRPPTVNNSRADDDAAVSIPTAASAAPRRGALTDRMAAAITPFRPGWRERRRTSPSSCGLFISISTISSASALDVEAGRRLTVPPRLAPVEILPGGGAAPTTSIVPPWWPPPRGFQPPGAPTPPHGPTLSHATDAHRRIQRVLVLAGKIAQHRWRGRTPVVRPLQPCLMHRFLPPYGGGGR